MEKKLKVLIIGNGGEAYSLARRLYAEGAIIYYLSGNYGLYMLGCNQLNPEKFTTNGKIQKFVNQEEVNLTIILSNFWTANGLVQTLQGNGHLVIGSNKIVREVLQDRIVIREILSEIGINQPGFSSRSFESFYKFDGPWPVIIKNRFKKRCSKEFGYTWLDQTTVNQEVEKLLPKEHMVFIIEDHLQAGQEISVVVLCSQNSYIVMSAAYMYNQPVTGLHNIFSPVVAYSPSGFIESEVIKVIKQTIIVPFLGCMKYEEKPCCGFLSFKIMLVDNEYYLLDINQGLDGLESLLVSPLVNSTLHELMIKMGQELVVKKDQKLVTETDQNRFVEVTPSYSADEVIGYNKFLSPHSSKNIAFKNLKEEEDTQLIFGNVEYVQNKITAANSGPILSIISRGDNPVTLINEFANKALSQHFNNEYTDIGFVNEVISKLKESISIKDESLKEGTVVV